MDIPNIALQLIGAKEVELHLLRSKILELEKLCRVPTPANKEEQEEREPCHY